MIEIDIDDAPNTYVKPSPVAGYGLFASSPFKSGDLVINYNQPTTNWYRLKWTELTQEQIDRSYYVGLDEEYCVTCDLHSKFSYINHSRTPNCTWDIPGMTIKANRDIEKDEELFIDYRVEHRPTRIGWPEWI